MKSVFVSGLMVLVSASAFGASWGKDRLWNDERAEVAFYDAERIVDEKPRQFKEQIIIQREELDPETLAKPTDPKSKNKIRVFKMNDVQKIDSDNFPINLLTSVYVKAEPVSALVKVIVGVQDWNGTAQTIFQPSKTPHLQWFTTSDGVSDSALSLELKKDDLFEDQLSISLRDLPFIEGYQLRSRLWNSLTTSRGAQPQVQPVVISVTGQEVVRTTTGSLPCWIVSVERGTIKDQYWFEKKEPHILVKMDCSDGRKRLLTGRARWSYWDRRLSKPAVLN